MEKAENFPSWRYGPNGESRICESADDVPKGWTDHPSGDFGEPAAIIDAAGSRQEKHGAPATTTGNTGTANADKGETVPKRVGRPRKNAAKTEKVGKVPDPALASARKAWKAKFGKNPNPRLTAAQITAKLAEAEDL